ncbi:MAG: PEP/pyruvate-binding domain-containing protein [Nitrososphaerota archaeon]
MSKKEVYIIKPEEITLEYDEKLIGRRIFELKKLMDAGFNIPQGFVITSNAFKSFLEQSNDAKSRIENVLQNFPNIEEKELESRIEKIFNEIHYPSQIEKEIIESYKELSEKLRIVDAPVSIKIIFPSYEEDFFEKEEIIEIERKFQNIRGERDLLSCIKKIWSLALIKLFLKMEEEKDLEKISIALFIQKSIHAKSSGIITPFNPEDLDRSKILIESIWGLIDPLIFKEFKSDTFIIDKYKKEIVNKKISKKTIEYIFDPLGGGLIHKIFIPSIRQDAPSLSNEEILFIIDLALKAEEIFPSERLILWSLDKDLPIMYGLTIIDVWKPKLIVEAKPPEIIPEVIIEKEEEKKVIEEKEKEEVIEEKIEEEVIEKEIEVIEEKKIELPTPKIEIIEKPFLATATKVFVILDAKNYSEFLLESFFDGFLIKGLSEDLEELLNIEEKESYVTKLIEKYRTIIEKNLFKQNIILIRLSSNENKEVNILDLQLNIIYKIIEENRLKNINLLFLDKEVNKLNIDKINSIKDNFLNKGINTKLFLEIDSSASIFSINEIKKFFNGFLINGDSLIKETFEGLSCTESLNNSFMNIINQIFSNINLNENQTFYLSERDRFDLEFIKYLLNKGINALIVKPEMLRCIKEYIYSIELELLLRKK